MNSVEQLIKTCKSAQHFDYIGEPVSQLEHMSQAAWFAQKSGADEELILAAFLHDIGHISAPSTAKQMAGLGVLNHEQIGAEHLQQIGFSARVTDLVHLHVQAKRYLCWKNPSYYHNLSVASKGTLEFQGGIMNQQQATEFEQNPLFKDILRLRTWDEQAKKVNGPKLDISTLKQIMQNHLQVKNKPLLMQYQKEQWRTKGAIHIPQFFSDGQALQRWAQELSDKPETPHKWMKYFEKGSKSRQLCRIENFLQYHQNWEKTIYNERLMQILSELFAEEAVLFKEKLNFKLPGGNGFTAHQDAPAFASFGQTYHITAMISIDETTTHNGCLEMGYGHHKSGLLKMTEQKVLAPEVIDEIHWEPLETQPGDLVLFDSYIPHRSGPNTTSSARRAAYVTYNPRSQGDKRADYYQHKRQVFPPEIERIPGKVYQSGLYNIGNPIEEK